MTVANIIGCNHTEYKKGCKVCDSIKVFNDNLNNEIVEEFKNRPYAFESEHEDLPMELVSMGGDR